MTTETPPADAGQGGAAPAAATADWTAGLPDEARGYVQLKGWKAPADLLNSYQNLEKLRGVPAERLLALPEKADDPKWGEVYQRLGVPQKPDEYGLTAMEGADPEFSSKAAEWFHKHNIPKAAAAGLAQEFNAFMSEQQKAIEADLTAKAEAEVVELKSEWGPQHDKNVEVARRAAKEFGLTEDLLNGIEQQIGYKATMALFHKIGSSLGEPEPVGMGTSPGGRGVMTKEMALARISQLKQDTTWGAKYLNRDADAVAEMERLHKIAYPG
jgi:hypothetical protein